MSMYYLHRAGETTGPYAPGRLGMMLDAGEITATDQVCEVGTEEWLPVEFVRPIDAEPRRRSLLPPPPRKPKRRTNSLALFGMTLALMLAGLGMYYAAWFIAGSVAFVLGFIVFVVALCINHLEHTGRR